MTDLTSLFALVGGVLVFITLAFFYLRKSAKDEYEIGSLKAVEKDREENEKIASRPVADADALLKRMRDGI